MSSPITQFLLLGLLAAATWADLRTRKIPNFLSLGGIIVGMTLSIIFGGLAGLANATLGLFLGFGAFIPLYALRAMGAGDVKLMAMVGSFLGPALTVQALLYTLLAGGVLAIVAVLRTDGVKETVARYAFGIRHLVTTRKWLGSRSREAPASRLKFPYALAIAAGSVMALHGPKLIPV